MYKSKLLILAALFCGLTGYAKVYHVGTKGNDHNPGTKNKPLRSIRAAAALAVPGDTVLVHQGIYREWVNPPRGGASADKRITYMAVPRERVVITGAEQVSGWKHAAGNSWRIALANDYFKDFNPYSDLIHGDWFNDRGRLHHTGAVYMDGVWLPEADSRAVMSRKSQSPTWFGEVGTDSTVIIALFGKGIDPNRRLTEINVRQKVFYPEKTGINYITVKGFIMRDAATNWAPPTAEQMGLIGTNWSKGWVIEDNDVAYSRCSGISLGKYGDRYDNTSANTAEGYVATVKRALADGWSKANIGGHLVRNNVVSHCEQAGVVGSLGCAFSTVSGNTIHDIWVQRLFAGAEMAGIKFHGAIDVTISNNHIYRARRGIWLDWMAQGTRVTGNVLNNNDQDIFLEVDHGPFLLEGNFFLSNVSFLDGSGGGAMIANVFAGTIKRDPQDRKTPYFKPHSSILAGIELIDESDMRFYNNLFLGVDSTLTAAFKGLAIRASGNLFGVKAAIGCQGKRVTIALARAFNSPQTITSAMLGKASVPDCAFENPDGSPVQPGTDFLLTMHAGRTYELTP